MLATDAWRSIQMTASRVRLNLFSIGLPVVMLLAAALRFWSIDFGLPLVTHPDEPLVFDAAHRMIAGQSHNPGWFRYPAFIIDIQAVILSVIFAIDETIGLSHNTIQSIGYEGGRIVMASFGIATVALTGLLGRRLARIALRADLPNRPERVDFLASIAGLVAAGMLAVSFIHVKDSHYLKPDIPTGFFTTLTLWFTLAAWKRLPLGGGSGFLLTGVAVGLAAAAKYNGAVVAVVPVTALLLLVLRDRRSERGMTVHQAAKNALWMGVVAVAVFLLFNPYVLLAPGEFLSPVDGIRAELEHYRTGHDGAEGNDSWRWYLLEVWRNGFGPTLTPLVLLGGGMAMRRLVAGWSQARERGSRSESDVLWLPIVFVVVYYAMIARFPVRFDRQLIPILPYLALLGGFGVASTLALAGRAFQHRRIAGQRLPIAAGAIALILVSALAVPQALHAADWDIQTGEQDTRYLALDWIEQHIPPGTTIAREWHTPPVGQAGYEDIDIQKANDQTIDWYRASNAEYLILSSFMYDRYLDAPEAYPLDAAFYTRLLALPRAATIDGENGPVIVIYRLVDAAPAFR